MLSSQSIQARDPHFKFEITLRGFTNPLAGLQNGLANLQTHFAGLQNGFADLQTHFATLQSGFANLQTHFATLRAPLAISRGDFELMLAKSGHWEGTVKTDSSS